MDDYIKMQFQKCFDTFRGKLLQVFLLEMYLVSKQLSFWISSIFHFVSCVIISHILMCACCSVPFILASLSFFYPFLSCPSVEKDIAVEGFLGCYRILQGNVNIPLSLPSTALNYTNVPLRQVSSPCRHLGNSFYSYIANLYTNVWRS